jgi:hypothetical protein
MAGALTVAVSLVAGTVLYSFYLYYAKPVMMKVEDRVTHAKTQTSAPDMRTDEEASFFPTSACFDENAGTWNAPIHGIMCEPERYREPMRTRSL